MAVTIRKFTKAMLDIDWLVHIGSLTQQAKEYLNIAVQAEPKPSRCRRHQLG